MKYSLLDGTGLVVSRLALGTMTFGEGALVAGVHNRIDANTAQRMVGRALEAGINLFDSADLYLGGEAERLLGLALQGRRDEAVIATKAGFRSGGGLLQAGGSFRHLVAACEASLKRLGTDHIDLYQLHIPDPLTPLEESLRALEHLVQSGKVRYAGLCNHPAWRTAQALQCERGRGRPGRIVSAQMHYSLLHRDLEHEFVPMLESERLALLVWSPLAGGFLSGKYTRDDPHPEGARRNTFQFPPLALPRAWAVVETLAEIAAEHQATPAQVALAWLLDKPFVTSVLVGAANPAQLAENLGAATLELDPQALARLDAITRPPVQYPGWMLPMGYDSRLREALEG